MNTNMQTDDKIQYARQICIKHGFKNGYRFSQNKQLLDNLCDYFKCPQDEVFYRACNIDKETVKFVKNGKDTLPDQIKKCLYLAELFIQGTAIYNINLIKNLLSELKTVHYSKGYETFTKTLKENNVVYIIEDRCSYFTPDGTLLISKELTNTVNLNSIWTALYFSSIGIDTVKQFLKKSFSTLGIHPLNFNDKILDSKLALALLRAEVLDRPLSYIWDYELDPDKYMGYNCIVMPSYDPTKVELRWVGEGYAQSLLISPTVLNGLASSGQLDKLHVEDEKIYINSMSLEKYIEEGMG